MGCRLLSVEPGGVPRALTTLPPPQLSCYDQAKQLVLSTGYLPDNIVTHFIASFIAVSAGAAPVGVPDRCQEPRAPAGRGAGPPRWAPLSDRACGHRAGRAHESPGARALSVPPQPLGL